MTEYENIRRRPDGSIDTAHYIGRGHVHRSVAAHKAAGLAMQSARKPLLGIATLMALLPSIGSQG